MAPLRLWKIIPAPAERFMALYDKFNARILEGEGGMTHENDVASSFAPLSSITKTEGTFVTVLSEFGIRSQPKCDHTFRRETPLKRQNATHKT